MDRLCCLFRAMQTQLAQQHDTIKELEEKISITTLEMIKVCHARISEMMSTVCYD